MKPPIILRADDGLSWWTDPRRLELYIESPDIEDGIYSAWDSLGQVLQVLPLTPVEKGSFFGLKTASISPGRIVETGIFHTSELLAIVRSHLLDRYSSVQLPDANLASILELFFSVQPREDC